MTTKPSNGSSAQSPRAAFWVGAGIFLSRIAGFVRGALEARLFGATGLMDVWTAGARIPNVIQLLLGEGTLSASMIPVYAEMLEEGREEDAGRFAGAALGLITVTAWSIALVGMLAAPWIAALFTKFDPAQQALLTRLLRLLFPMVAFISMSAWALAILNSHRKFFISYVAPTLWNLSLITTLVVFGVVLGWSEQGRDADVMIALGWGALIGGLLQLLIQVPWIRPVLSNFRLSVSTRVAGVREAIRGFLPIVSARGVVSMSGVIEIYIASFLAAGAISHLYFAYRFYLLPISLFGLAIAAAELPELSRLRGEGAGILAERVRDGLWRVWYFVVPVGVAYLVMGDLILGTMYEGGDFGRDSTIAVYFVLGAYSLGLPATASSRMLSSAFFALRDTRTPAILSVLRMALSFSAGIALMLPLDGLSRGDQHFGAVGLALGSSIAAWVEYVILRIRLGRAVPDHGAGVGRSGRVLVAAALGGIAAFGTKLLLGSAYPARAGLLADWLGEGAAGLTLPLSALGTALVFGVVWFASASFMGVGGPLRSFLKRS